MISQHEKKSRCGCGVRVKGAPIKDSGLSNGKSTNRRFDFGRFTTFLQVGTIDPLFDYLVASLSAVLP
jgi:hypothetical protein